MRNEYILHPFSLINDRDLMMDFLALTKKEFLEFYPHITENMYRITSKDYKLLYGNTYKECDNEK